MTRLGRMARFVLPYRWRFALFVITAIGYSAFHTVPLLLVRRYLEIVIEAGDLGEFWLLVVLILAVFPIAVLFFITREITSQYLAHVVVRDATNRVAAHLLTQRLAYFDTYRGGELISRIGADASALARTVGIFTALVKEPITVLCVLGVLVGLNWQLTFVGLVGFPLAAWPIAVLSAKIREASKRTAQRAADLAHVMVQTFGGMRVVKGFGREDTETDRFKATNNGIFRYTMKRVRADALLKGTVEMVNSIGIVLVVIVGGLLCIRKVVGFTPADFLTFIAALMILHRPVRNIGSVNAQLQESLPRAERLFELLDADEPLPVGPAAVHIGPPCDAIRLRGVSFSYGREQVLKGIDLEIPAGKTTAIVGPSGSGKSTVVNLVARFYDPLEGVVEVDGIDLREVQPGSWLEHLGLVTQDPLLFYDTIAGNIRYGRLDATDGEIGEAARLANIHDEVMKLPEAYQTHVGERGAQLSGGQRQRVCLARALVRNPAVLLLDEATSSLDSASEKVVQEAIERAEAGRTSIVVAHRLSTVRNADRIYVLVGGAVEASGTHDELLRSSPTYRRLWEIQQGEPA